MRKPQSRGLAPKVTALGVVACLIAAACGSATVTGTPPPGPSSSAPSQPSPAAPPSPNVARTTPSCVVGEAWNNYAEERIDQWDRPALEKPIAAAGGAFEVVDAKSSIDTQRTQIDELVQKGVKVIVIRAQGGSVGMLPPASVKAIERAVAAGVPVIAYDDLVDSPKVLWVSFDEVESGRMEARAILVATPKGNYVILRGMKGQPLEDLRSAGIHEVLQPAIDRGDIKIVAEPYTVNWDPNTALDEMRSILTKNQNKVDAVIAESDGMAGGAYVALKEVGLAGQVTIAGRDGDWASLNRVAAGFQTVDVWSDLRLTGTAAGNAAVALCQHPDISKLTGTALYTSPGHNQIPSILIPPQAITRDNLDVVLKAGWLPKDYLCRDISPSTAPAVCQ